MLGFPKEQQLRIPDKELHPFCFCPTFRKFFFFLPTPFLPRSHLSFLHIILRSSTSVPLSSCLTLLSVCCCPPPLSPRQLEIRSSAQASLAQGVLNPNKCQPFEVCTDKIQNSLKIVICSVFEVFGLQKKKPECAHWKC